MAIYLQNKRFYMSDQGKQLHTIPAVAYPPMGGFELSPMGPWVDSNPPVSTWQGKGNGNKGPKTVLVVDDDASVRRLTATVLETYGYNVIEADSGFEGLERFAEHHGTIDLVLTDIVMPHMTGPEMIETILAMDPSFPVMLMSGCAMGLKVPEAIPILPKPFTAGVLLQASRARLDSRTAAINII
jgi:CheY-like chemotaxis protein